MKQSVRIRNTRRQQLTSQHDGDIGRSCTRIMRTPTHADPRKIRNAAQVTVLWVSTSFNTSTSMDKLLANQPDNLQLLRATEEEELSKQGYVSYEITRSCEPTTTSSDFFSKMSQHFINCLHTRLSERTKIEVRAPDIQEPRIRYLDPAEDRVRNQTNYAMIQKELIVSAAPDSILRWLQGCPSHTRSIQGLDFPFKRITVLLHFRVMDSRPVLRTLWFEGLLDLPSESIIIIAESL